MHYEKTILCLANSRKTSGRCIAGREVVNGGYGSWIRPISNRPSGEISEEDRRYENGTTAQVLDVVCIPLLKNAATTYQSENHLIDDGYYWRRIRTGCWKDVVNLVDTVAGPLWVNGHSTYHGRNDQVPEVEALNQPSSLILARPEGLQIRVSREDRLYGPAKRRVRALFTLAGASYILQVTDPKVESRYLAGNDGQFPIDSALLCISLGELWNGHAYKLIATVLTPELVG